jgi:hypothetical protein
MPHQQVPASHGLQWLTDAVQLILKNPVPFLLMGLVVGVIWAVPVISLVLVVLAPALYGGIIYAAREQHAGRAADFQHLFEAFKQEAKLPKMLMLCLPSVAAFVVICLLVAILIGSALIGAGFAGGARVDPAALLAGLGTGGFVAAILALLVSLAAAALTFFAMPRVMLESAEPLAAMKDSLSASLANAGAILVLFGLLFLGLLVLGVLVGWIPALGPLLTMTAFAPLAAVTAFCAWRDVYRQPPITQELPPANPPPGPDAGL